MTTITQATQDRIKKMIQSGNAWGNELQYIFETMQGSVGWLGASIKDMKACNTTMENSTQINIVTSNLMRGMGVLYPDYIYVVDCLDLRYVTIKDFNALVKACLDNPPYSSISVF